MTAETCPEITDGSVVFRLPVEQDVAAGVRLVPALSLPDVELDFGYGQGEWRLTLPRPPVWRMEYRFQVRHPSGGDEEICDPGNPRRAPGAFGDKSVVEFPDYVAPWWLTADRVEGSATEAELGGVAALLWAPADATPTEPLPLLVAHDGPEYDRLSGLTGYAAALVHAGRLPRHRVLLLAPGDRNERYSANPAYSRTLRDAVLPGVRNLVAVDGPVVGMGASLGGLAMLHAQRCWPGLFGGLFLQSASFLDTVLDPHEVRFGRFPRVSAYTSATLRAISTRDPVPVTLTCGTAEENLANNRQMAKALRAQGYPVELVEVPDAHNYVGWRDAFDPALTELLRGVWGAANAA